MKTTTKTKEWRRPPGGYHPQGVCARGLHDLTKPDADRIRHGTKADGSPAFTCGPCRRIAQAAKMHAYRQARRLARQGAVVDADLAGTAERVLAIVEHGQRQWRKDHPERHRQHSRDYARRMRRKGSKA